MKFEVWVWKDGRSRQLLDVSREDALAEAEKAMERGDKIEIRPMCCREEGAG